jgi:hypothetical protein
MSNETFIIPVEQLLELKVVEAELRATRAELKLAQLAAKEIELKRERVHEKIAALVLAKGAFDIAGPIDIATGTVERKPSQAELSRRRNALNAVVESPVLIGIETWAEPEPVLRAAAPPPVAETPHEIKATKVAVGHISVFSPSDGTGEFQGDDFGDPENP